MVRRGIEPFLECSSKGDRRFSAFHAMIGKFPIEAYYQSYKNGAKAGDVLPEWRTFKGLPPTHPNPPSIENCRRFYKHLWNCYLLENPELKQHILDNYKGLTDVFGREGNVCQSAALYELIFEDKTILICGGRDFRDKPRMEFVIEKLIIQHGNKFTILQGGANGADNLAGIVAKEKNLKVIVMPADWNTHGKSAGFIRNSEMLKLLKSTNNGQVIAFWDNKSSGTKHTIDNAQSMGIPVEIISY